MSDQKTINEIRRNFRPGSDLDKMFMLLSDGRTRSISQIQEVVKAKVPSNIGQGKYQTLKRVGYATGKFEMVKTGTLIALRWRVGLPGNNPPVTEFKPVVFKEGETKITLLPPTPVSAPPRPSSDPVAEFEKVLRGRVVGQEEAVQSAVDQYTLYKAGAVLPGRPIGITMMLGPTGSGKTLTAESVAFALHGDAKKMIKIDCAEFQLEHEVSKLIGAPPAFLGHRETAPRFSNQEIEEKRSPRSPITVVLLDELEKAHESFRKILLGIFDKGGMTDGQGRYVNFNSCWFFMTSNLGARELFQLSQEPEQIEIKKKDRPGVGFTSSEGKDDTFKISKTAAISEMAQMILQSTFAPEFVGRIDSVVVFRSLTKDEFSLIMDLETKEIGRVLGVELTLDVSSKDALLLVSINAFYGARSLKQGLRKHLTLPIARFKIVNPGKKSLLIGWNSETKTITIS